MKINVNECCNQLLKEVIKGKIEIIDITKKSIVFGCREKTKCSLEGWIFYPEAFYCGLSDSEIGKWNIFCVDLSKSFKLEVTNKEGKKYTINIPAGASLYFDKDYTITSFDCNEVKHRSFSIICHLFYRI